MKMKMETLDHFCLDRDTVIVVPEKISRPVQNGLEIFLRDLENIIGTKPLVAHAPCPGHNCLFIRYALQPEPIAAREEAFALQFFRSNDQHHMQLTGSDDLGIIYGLLHISREYLGVDPFWFWTEQQWRRQERIPIPAREYISRPYRIRYRGWFVNDEVCLIGWSKTYPPSEEVWRPVYETLLRTGGNMVIPGTDLPRDGVHLPLAADMGLWLTQHHAEPLGAEMFARAYPHAEASYVKNHALFEKLWQESIDKLKDNKVIWVLGFRGQGDCPFWEQDPACDTPAKQGEIISRVIERQYEMVCEKVNQPVCAAYLYGEIMELYRQGHIRFPDGVVKIWSDNGYGRMVSRRQGNHNPRVPALPGRGEAGPHGVYYHVTFHDLQASSHLTLLTNPLEMVGGELGHALAAGADRYLLVNCGNIRPHVYTLGAISAFWREGTLEAALYNQDFGARFFSSAALQAAACYRDYAAAAIPYGEHEDDRAGEEFYHHPARIIIGHWMTGRSGEPAPALEWLGRREDLAGQVQLIHTLCEKGLQTWERLHGQCQNTLQLLKESEARFFTDNILHQVALHCSGCRGLIRLCQSFAAWQQAHYAHAFVYASQSLWEYSRGLEILRAAERGKWQNFYSADWLTNIRCTVDALESLRRFLRMFGDSPDFFLWYKEYLMPEGEKEIYLENTHRRPLENDELALRLAGKFGMS
jgi:hypothetical protein